MTCYLTGHDDRFAAAVAGGVVADLTSMGGTSDDAHLINDFEIGAMPWDRGRPRAPRRDVAVHRRRQGHHPDARAARRGRRPLPRRAGGAVALRAARARHPDPPRRSTRVPATSSRSSASRATASTTPRASSSGSSSTRGMPRARVPRRSTPRTGSAASRRSPNGTRCPARSSASCAWARREDEIVTGAHRHPQQEHHDRRARDEGLDLPDRLDLEGVDRDGHHAAHRRGQAVARHAREGRHPRAEAQSNDELTDGITMWHLLTHTSGLDGDVFTDTGRGDDCLEKYVADLATPRRTTRSVRPGRTATPATRVLGHVIDEGHRQDVGCRDARAAVPAARAHAHRDAARGGDPVRRRRRARRHGRRAGRDARVGSHALARPGRPHHGPRRGRARVRPPAHGRRRHRRRHAAARGGDRRRHAGVPRRGARQARARRLVGPGLDPLRLERRAALRPRRQHHRTGGVPAHPPRDAASR